MSKKKKDDGLFANGFVPGGAYPPGAAPYLMPDADIMTYPEGENLRLDPEKRVCPEYDRRSVREYDLPGRDMGFRVIDNCCEENQQ